MVEKYISHQVAEGKIRHSFVYLERIWTPLFHSRWLRDITHEEIETLLNRYAQEHKLAPASRNNVLNQLSGLFNYSIKRGWVKENPCRHIPKLRVDNARTRWLRPHEVEAILHQCEPWLQDIVNFAVRTGLRLGEILNLKCSDYFQDAHGNALLAIRHTKNRHPHHVPLEGTVKALVERRMKELGLKPTQHLFTGPFGGNPYSSIRRFLQPAVEAAGLVWGEKVDGITFHTFRHSMASLALNAGVPESVVQRLGNWKSRIMVARYAHLSDDTLRQAAGKLDNLL